MTTDEMATMLAEIALGVPKAESKFSQDPEFDELWDAMEADVKALDPETVLEIPYDNP